MRRKIEDMKIDNKTLKLVRDIPKFESEYSKEKDKFNHKAYADTILRIIKDNEAPLVIGLLGPWGAGKSTILNLLMQSLKENKNYKFVYFNAWKYSDDSFRRQFIIECVDSLIEEKKKREKIKSKFKQRFLREIKKEVFSWKDLFKIIKTDISTAIRLSVSLFIVILVLIIGIYLKNHLLSLSSILMAVIIFILTEQIPKLIQFNIPIDPQLVLPEQFEDEFEKLIKKIKNKNIVFIIDDIDRCPARMIMDILDSVKNFLAPSSRNVNNNIYNKCYFIIAMDNNAVTSILKKERGEEYEKEEVLKFFDTTVRLSPLRIGDLIEFSKFVAKETNISEEVIQVAIYGGFDTPRKIKHFLNSFNVVYHIAKERYKEGTFPFEPQKISSIIAKVLILQLVFPYEFEKLVEDISLLEKWEKEAEKIFKGNQGVDKTNEKDFSYKNLLKFLWATKDIRITDIDAFLHFKLPAYATKLPDFSLFKNAIVENDIAQIKELMKEIETFQQKDALIELLRDILEIHPTDIFLSNILQSAITIYKLLDLPHQLNENFSNLLIRHILRAENILSFDPEIVFELLEYVKEKAKWTDDIINLSIQNINEGTNPVNISKFIKILYEKEYNMKDFKKALTSKEINEKLKELGEKKPLWIIQVLKDLKLPKGKEYKNFNNPVPNPEIIKNLISLLNEKEENIELNKNIISISYKFWHKEYIDLIIQKCIHILNYYNQQNVSSINSPIELVLGIIENMPERVPPNLSLGIADQLWSLYTRCPNQEEKVKIMKSYILSVSSIPRSQIGNRFTNIIGQIAAYNLPYFKEIFKFISKYKKIDGNWRWNLENNIIQSSLNNILNNPIESNLNKFNFIYSKKRRFIQDNELKQIIIKIVTQSSDNVFEIWRSQLIKATIKEKNLRESIINELKKKIEDPNFQIPKDRRRKILDFLLEVIKKLHDDSLNTQIGEWIFKFSEISHLQPLFPQYLNEANNLLRSKFRTYINAKVKNLCSKNLDFINSQLFVLNAYLKFQNKLDREALIFFTDVLIRAIQSRNSTFVNMAYNLLVEGVKIDTRKKRDLIDSIESLILHFPQEKEKWERILSELKISKRKMKK